MNEAKKSQQANERRTRGQESNDAYLFLILQQPSGNENVDHTPEMQVSSESDQRSLQGCRTEVFVAVTDAKEEVSSYETKEGRRSSPKLDRVESEEDLQNPQKNKVSGLKSRTVS